MEDRNVFIDYNYAQFSEEEMRNYESSKISDNVLAKMKERTKILYKRANMEETFERVEDQFEDDEKVKYVFWGNTYGVFVAQNMAGCFSAPITANWSSWPTKTGIILTNKGIFGVETNDGYLAMKIKHFKFSEVEYIETKKMDGIYMAFTIHPVKGKEIKLEILKSDKHYIKFLKLLKDNNIKLDVRFTGRSTKTKIILAIEILLIIILWGAMIAGIYSSCIKAIGENSIK